MSGDSTYFGNLQETWLKGTQFPAPPAACYLALFNGDPTDAGTSGTEVTTSARAAGRLAITWGAVSGKQMANTAVADFGNAAAAFTPTHFAVFDAATGGNMLGSNPLTTGTGAVSAGTDYSFPVGSLVWKE